MMTGIEIVFFLLYCGLAVALALWASRVRMRSATPFSTNSPRLSIFLPFFFAGLSAGLSAAAAPLPDPNCPPPASPLEPCRPTLGSPCLIHRPTKTEVTAVVAALCRACVLRSLRQTDADHLHERRTAVAASALRGVVEWLLRSQPILSRNTNNRDS